MVCLERFDGTPAADRPRAERALARGRGRTTRPPGCGLEIQDEAAWSLSARSYRSAVGRSVQRRGTGPAPGAPEAGVRCRAGPLPTGAVVPTQGPPRGR